MTRLYHALRRRERQGLRNSTMDGGRDRSKLAVRSLFRLLAGGWRGALFSELVLLGCATRAGVGTLSLDGREATGSYMEARALIERRATSVHELKPDTRSSSGDAYLRHSMGHHSETC